jgi:hypothetical protein
MLQLLKFASESRLLSEKIRIQTIDATSLIDDTGRFLHNSTLNLFENLDYSTETVMFEAKA